MASPGNEEHARRGRSSGVMRNLPQREAWRTSPSSSPNTDPKIVGASPSLTPGKTPGSYTGAAGASPYLSSARGSSSAMSDAGRSNASSSADTWGSEAVEAIKQSRIAKLTSGGAGGTIEEDFVLVPGSAGMGGQGTPGSAGRNVSNFNPNQNFTIVSTASEEEEILDEDGLPLLPEEKELYLLAKAKETGSKIGSKSGSKSAVGGGLMGGLSIGGGGSSSSRMNNDTFHIGASDQDMEDINNLTSTPNSRDSSQSPLKSRSSKNRSSPAKVSRETIIQNYEQMFHEVMANRETIKKYEQGFEKLQFLAAQESYAVLHRPDEVKGNAAVLAEAEAEAKRLE